MLETGRIPGPGVLARMTDAIAHRGPDDHGYSEHGTRDGRWHVAFGHRRLSILDLEGGHQPLADSRSGNEIVFNGEIYNYRALRAELELEGFEFSTRSDTEVVLAAYTRWGEACVRRLEGMFAFAIWDAKREGLFLGRDRFGKKPLFVTRIGSGIAFASEIKSLLQIPGVETSVNESAVWLYLGYRYVPGPMTLFESIFKLPPGCVATFISGRFTVERFYFPPDRQDATAVSVSQDPAREFARLFGDAVDKRMVCDVPFGAFLSGGIDSSAVVAMMTRYSDRPIETFSVGFQMDEYSELDHARHVAEHFGTNHHELVVTEQEMMSLLPELIGYRDAPVSEPSDIPIYLLSLHAARHVKMVLTGEGSDETLGGYPKHRFEPWVGAYQMLPGWVRRGLIPGIVSRLPYRFRRARTALQAMDLELPADRYPAWFGALPPDQRRRLAPGSAATSGLAACAGTRKLAEFLNEPFASTASSPLRQLLYFDQTSWLPDNLLERGDRMTMAASIEARMPFLDHHLVEFAASVPDRFRIRGNVTKFLLRESVRELLPRSILDRPKVGFRVPVNEWFKGPMREYLADSLTSNGSVTRRLYDRDELHRYIDEHVSGRVNHEKVLWTLLNLELWWQAQLGSGADSGVGRRLAEARSGGVC
ncbi:MAG: asparagine synthase (glutamine-hydrolyzing) [Pseudomonadales bacterium]